MGINYALQAIAGNKSAEEKKADYKVVDIKELMKHTEAKKRTVTLDSFECTVAIKGNSVIFFAQLDGGARFACSPVMPKNAVGEVLAPPNGSRGYLTIDISENAELRQYADGHFEYSIRPEFNNWETREELEERKAKAKEKTKKV